MKLYSIRHAESHGNTKGKIISTMDFELTEKGIAQSLRIGQRLCAELEGKPVSAYCSCLARARQTLQEILRCIGQQDAVITQSHCLKEMDDAHSIIIVSHGITLRILTNLLLNRPDSDVNDLNWMETTALTELVREKPGHTYRIVRLNDYSHLKELKTDGYENWGLFAKHDYLKL